MAPPMTLANLPPWPHFPADERAAVDRVLESGKVNQWTGSEVNGFGDEFARFHDSKFAIPNANGTVAIELALRALGVKGDVIVPAATFVATAAACVNVGAKPIVADIDPDTHGLAVETIEAVATEETEAVIPVHFGGRPVDVKAIKDLCEDRGWKLIEDCAQAHGAEVDGQKVGTFGDIGCFSFCQDKIISTGGEGGICITDNEELFKRMWSYKDHGKDYDLCFNAEHPPGYRWLHESFGTNWRMTEMQAAIGRIQLQKLPAWLDTRKRNADILASYLSDLDGVRIPTVPSNVKHAFYKFNCYLENGKRNAVQAALNQRGIPATIGSCSEIYREGAFRGTWDGKRLPNAARLQDSSLCFQVHPTITAESMHEIGAITRETIQST